MSMTRFTIVILMLGMLTGCATSSSGWPSFAKRDPDARQAKNSRGKLKNPTKLDLLYGKLQEEQGNTSEARQRYQRVLREEPQSVEALLGLARMDQLAGRAAEAEQGFRKALKISANDPLVLDAFGQFYASQEKWPQAIDILKQGLQAAPNDNRIRFHLAVATAKSGDLATAKSLFVSSVGEAEADYNLGVILHDQGKLELAEQHFAQSVLKKPTLEQAQYWLNEIRVEKETKHLLAGTNQKTRSRPDLQAPAGALPATTTMHPAPVVEYHLSPNDVLGIQQTAAQQSTVNSSPYANQSNVAPAFGANAADAPNASRSTSVVNPFAAGTPPQVPNWGSLQPQSNSGLTPQQLEQLRNQR